MTFDVIMTIYIILNGIVVHIMWKRIENLEDWVMHLLEQTEKEFTAYDSAKISHNCIGIVTAQQTERSE